MKKISFLLIAAISFVITTSAQVLVSERFEGGSYPPPGWTKINISTTNGRNWHASDVTTAVNDMVYEFSSFSNANAWLITPSIQLTSGSDYKISFAYRVRSANTGSAGKNLKVTIGNTATMAGQTMILWGNSGGTQLTNTTFATASIPFTASSTGDFFVGFNCFSDAGKWAVQITDIVIERIDINKGTPENFEKGNSFGKLTRVENVAVSEKSTKTTSVGISSIYPNPVTDQITLVLTSSTFEKVSIEIIDFAGKVIYKIGVQLAPGENSLLKDVSRYASGTYIVKTSCANGCVGETMKFVKQ